VSLTPRPLYRRERAPGTDCVGSSVGPRSNLDTVERRPLFLAGNRTQVHRARPYSPLVSWPLIFQFHDHFTDRTTPWTSDQLVARPLPNTGQHKQNKHIHIPNFHFFCLHSGGWSPYWVHSARRPLNGLLYLPRVIMMMENLVE
jgi:hypothetical protein